MSLENLRCSNGDGNPIGYWNHDTGETICKPCMDRYCKENLESNPEGIFLKVNTKILAMIEAILTRGF